MSELLRGSDEQQRRVMLATGSALVVIAVLAASVGAVWPERRPPNTFDITVSTPTVGQGIDRESNVILRGVVVGRVTSLTPRNGQVDMRIRLDDGSVRGLTDAFGFDFRPQNTFGVSAMNLIPGNAGHALTDGQRIERAPTTNATMSQLLSGAATVVNGVITDQMAELMRNSADHLVALAPLVETGFVLANQIAETQSEDSAALLHKANRLLQPVPQLTESALTSVHALRNLKGNEHLLNNMEPALQTLDVVSTGLFGPVAEILGKHREDLTPATEIGRSFLDAISTIIQRSRGGLRLDKVLAGLRDTYGGPPGARSMKLRVVLEPLPALASGLPPLSALDGEAPR